VGLLKKNTELGSRSDKEGGGGGHSEVPSFCSVTGPGTVKKGLCGMRSSPPTWTWEARGKRSRDCSFIKGVKKMGIGSRTRGGQHKILGKGRKGPPDWARLLPSSGTRGRKGGSLRYWDGGKSKRIGGFI